MQPFSRNCPKLFEEKKGTPLVCIKSLAIRFFIVRGEEAQFSDIFLNDLVDCENLTSCNISR